MVPSLLPLTTYPAPISTISFCALPARDLVVWVVYGCMCAGVCLVCAYPLGRTWVAENGSTTAIIASAMNHVPACKPIICLRLRYDLEVIFDISAIEKHTR